MACYEPIQENFLNTSLSLKVFIKKASCFLLETLKDNIFKLAWGEYINTCCLFYVHKLTQTNRKLQYVVMAKIKQSLKKYLHIIYYFEKYQ